MIYVIRCSGLHLLEAVSSSDSTILTLQQRYDEYIYDQDYKNIQRAMSVSIIELAKCLKQVTSAKALKDFVNKIRGHSSTKQFSELMLAKLDLIGATIYKLESRYNEFFQSFLQILTHVWHGDIPVALAIFLQDPVLLKIGKQAMLSELVCLLNADLTELPYLLTPIVSAPNLIKYENRLQPNGVVTLVNHYESGILKQMDVDWFKSAMAYIDLCMAVSNRTCVASNWILACLHLYADLSSLSGCSENLPRAYAYRNLINELAINAFLLAREYLAPYVQIYIYKLVLLLVIHSNRCFSQLNKSSINPSHNSRIEEMFSCRLTVITKQILRNLINFSTFIPVMPVSALLSSDLLFYELVGFDFLRAYLKIMVQDNNNRSRYFYDYYLLEGVWNGWVMDEDFELIRQQSMRSLLANKNWTVSNVEGLLND